MNSYRGLDIAGLGRLLAALFSSELPTPVNVYAHEGHEHFSAGEPGDPKKPARTINIARQEDGHKNALRARRGSQFARASKSLRIVQ